MIIKKVEKKSGTSYRVLFNDGINQEGKCIQKTVDGFKTLTEAEEFLNSIDKYKLVIKSNSKQLVEPKSKKKYNPKTWNCFEVQQFIELANNTHNGLLYEVTLATGLRLGEVTGLSWSDVDFKEKTLTVSKAVTHGYSRDLITMLVNNKRTISLPDQLIEKLVYHKKNQEQLKVELGKNYQNIYNLVFTNKGGGIINPVVIHGQLKNLINTAGVREITFHGLRHTHFRLLMQNGEHRSCNS